MPIFIDFMQEALRTMAPEDFKAPKLAKLVSIRGHVEAFQPGTEPRLPPPPTPGGPAAAVSAAAHPLMLAEPVTPH